MTVRLVYSNGRSELWEIPDKEPPIALRKSRFVDSITGAHEIVLFKRRNDVQAINGQWTADYYEDGVES